MSIPIAGQLDSARPAVLSVAVVAIVLGTESDASQHPTQTADTIRQART